MDSIDVSFGLVDNFCIITYQYQRPFGTIGRPARELRLRLDTPAPPDPGVSRRRQWSAAYHHLQI